MAVVLTRQGLVQYCLRRLGEPVIEVNVDVGQIEDKVDDALQTYREFHSDATYRTYHQHALTADDITNEYITIPESIIYVTKMFPSRTVFGNVTGGAAMWSTDTASFGGNMAKGIAGGGLAYLRQARSYAALIDMEIIGLPLVTFSRRQNRLYIWSDIVDKQMKAGTYVCCEVYKTVEDVNIWNDMFMKDYTTALIKEQWGQNMSKFDGMQLPGGVTINGRTILEEAKTEIRELRERMRLEQEVPPDFLIG
jgi:hypothetical protein